MDEEIMIALPLHHHPSSSQSPLPFAEIFAPSVKVSMSIHAARLPSIPDPRICEYPPARIHGVKMSSIPVLHEYITRGYSASQRMAAAAQEADEPLRPAVAVKKSAPGQPWSHVETMHLIDVYEERWTKLRRGQLKAQQWEDVAAEVAARCGGGAASAQRKTGTQCRHKLEKLRKRYRTEGARPVTSLWPFFRRMERLERGPLPVSTFPPHAVSPPAAASDEEEEEDEDDEEEEEEQELLPRNNNTRSINGILRECGGFRGFAPRPPQPLQQPPPAVMLSTAPPRKRVAYEAFQAKAVADRVKAEDAPVGHSSGGVDAQFSRVLRNFSEGIMRLDRRRMEVQWEIERTWKETEARHNKMLQDAQRQLQETLAAASAAPAPGKKARRDHGSSGDAL